MYTYNRHNGYFPPFFLDSSVVNLAQEHIRKHTRIYSRYCTLPIKVGMKHTVGVEGVITHCATGKRPSMKDLPKPYLCQERIVALIPPLC
jgi:hypothetical protein